jgi:hypothetical protein
LNSSITNPASHPAQQEAKPDPPPAAMPSRFELWLQRIALAVYVLICMEMGMILLITPWTSLWLKDSELLAKAALRSLVLHDFVRGAVSGLGLINLWLGVTEVVHHYEKKP